MNDILKALHWRKAISIFDPNKKLSETQIQELLQALRLTPSSYGLQPWSFVLVEDVQKRQDLLPHSYHQQQVVEASHYLILARNEQNIDEQVHNYLNSMAATLNTTRKDLAALEENILSFTQKLSKENQLEHWIAKQVYIALGNILTCSAMMGIDACPMEGFIAEKYNEILGLADKQLHAQVSIALGYRNESVALTTFPLEKVRYPLEKLLFRI